MKSSRSPLVDPALAWSSGLSVQVGGAGTLAHAGVVLPRLSLNAWLRHLALDGQLAAAEPKALRFRLLGAPARHITHARKRILKIPPGWAWATDLVTAWDRLQALHPA